MPFPPSSNRYWRHNRGRTHRSKEANDYRDAVAYICNAAGVEPLDGDIAISMHFYRPAKRGDLDNRLKQIFDALQGYAYHDDKQVSEIHAVRHDDKENPRVEITLTEVAE